MNSAARQAARGMRIPTFALAQIPATTHQSRPAPAAPGTPSGCGAAFGRRIDWEQPLP